MTIFNACSTSRGLKMQGHESVMSACISYMQTCALMQMHTSLFLCCLAQLAGWDAMATVVAENIKKAWEMKDTLCASIVARACALRRRSQNLYLSLLVIIYHCLLCTWPWCNNNTSHHVWIFRPDCDLQTMSGDTLGATSLVFAVQNLNKNQPFPFKSKY